ncbi:hypothetical protein LEP1GSC188_4751 [Leptospira weilii serovar Topaz str. LT2116]|uniref:Uncharacterized protein n=1 Tax=Leptospira weilii serovar Topaz str. LT2116 TaxID=1088540 RepID=M3G8P9_9LEPT|nr:hypothetical protein LEP1GSC188_4751 [Leptospira weilii serovar Topaz str. LT2116]
MPPACSRNCRATDFREEHGFQNPNFYKKPFLILFFLRSLLLFPKAETNSGSTRPQIKTRMLEENNI